MDSRVLDRIPDKQEIVPKRGEIGLALDAYKATKPQELDDEEQVRVANRWADLELAKSDSLEILENPQSAEDGKVLEGSWSTISRTQSDFESTMEARAQENLGSERMGLVHALETMSGKDQKNKDYFWAHATEIAKIDDDVKREDAMRTIVEEIKTKGFPESGEAEEIFRIVVQEMRPQETFNADLELSEPIAERVLRPAKGGSDVEKNENEGEPEKVTYQDSPDTADYAENAVDDEQIAKNVLREVTEVVTMKNLMQDIEAQKALGLDADPATEELLSTYLEHRAESLDELYQQLERKLGKDRLEGMESSVNQEQLGEDLIARREAFFQEMKDRASTWQAEQEGDVEDETESAEMETGGAGEGDGGNENGGGSNEQDGNSEQEPLSPEDRLKRAWEISFKLAVIRDRYSDRLTKEDLDIIEAEEVFVIDMLEKYDPENRWAEHNEQVLHELGEATEQTLQSHGEVQQYLKERRAIIETELSPEVENLADLFIGQAEQDLLESKLGGDRIQQLIEKADELYRDKSPEEVFGILARYTAGLGSSGAEGNGDDTIYLQERLVQTALERYLAFRLTGGIVIEGPESLEALVEEERHLSRVINDPNSDSVQKNEAYGRAFALNAWKLNHLVDRNAYNELVQSSVESDFTGTFRPEVRDRLFDAPYIYENLQGPEGYGGLSDEQMAEFFNQALVELEQLEANVNEEEPENIEIATLLNEGVEHTAEQRRTKRKALSGRRSYLDKTFVVKEFMETAKIPALLVGAYGTNFLFNWFKYNFWYPAIKGIQDGLKS